ncbi:MAG: mandelate racemase/muconate lactonizing enzyme family protein [Planctomycetes bacterium]|nr:mandelate racemase/muconate lactonizing enzyme family protein [Planctomycetota bacterium]
MIVSDLEFYLVEIPQSDTGVPVRSLLVRLLTESGLEGWGEALSQRAAWQGAAWRDALAPTLVGRSVFDVEELLQLESLRDATLRSAVEMASWDLIGRFAGLPVCQLFGGEYRKWVPLAARLSGDSPQQIGVLAHELAEQGFHAQVIVSSGCAETDLRVLAAVRQSVGDGVELRLDGAAQYELDGARDLCRQLEVDPPQCFLDPLASCKLDQIASLGRQTSVPLAVSRGIAGPADVMAAARCHAAPFLSLDPQAVGGMTAARRCAAVASAAGISVLLGGAGWLGVATAAMLHLAASTASFSSGNESRYGQLQDDVLTDSLEIVNGMIAVPQSPGLGVEVDRAKVERYQVD